MKLVKIFVSSFIILLLASCSGQINNQSSRENFAPILDTPDLPQKAIGEEGDGFSVDTLKVAIRESNPVQVAVIVTGTLSDSCTLVDQIDAELTNSVFELKISTIRETGLNCNPQETQFEDYYLLDVEGLSTGIYDVSFDELTTSFVLEEDYESPDYSSG